MCTDGRRRGIVRDRHGHGVNHMSIFKPIAGLAIVMSLASAAAAATPSFDCQRKLNDAEKIICDNDDLATLDRKLGAIFVSAARSMPQDKTVAYFVAEQRDWVRDRNDCPNTHDPVACLSSVYRTRIAELQARFNLVPSRGPFRFACGGDPPQEVVVTWFDTDPPSGLLGSTRGQTMMFAVAAGSGTRYIGDDVEFAEHQGTATVTWGMLAREMSCKLEK